MLIERELTISIPRQDAADVHPRGPDADCIAAMRGHHFFAEIEGCGFKYSICGRCGTVRISEQR